MVHECERCHELLKERITRFDRLRNIKGGVPILRREIDLGVRMLFPGAFELLFNPSKWTADSIPSFPVLSHDQRRTTFGFDVVDAPLPFTAACIRITCDRCGMNHRPVVLNSSFMVLMTHLTAAGLDMGLESRLLAELFHVLHSDPRPLDDFQTASDDVPREDIYAGAVWLALHEFGHIVGNPLIRAEQVKAPEPSRAAVASELNADIAAFRVLEHRTTANRHWGDTFPNLVCGVEIVLRTLAAISPSDGIPRLLRETRSQVSFGHPTPWQRWSAIRAWAGISFRLGAKDRNGYREYRAKLLGGFDHAVDAMRQASIGRQT